MATQRPQLDHMIISVNRHKLSNDDIDWTAQFPLKKLVASTPRPLLIDNLLFSRLRGEIMEILRSETEAEGLSIVWVMASTNQLGVVRDNDSLQAAVLDHQHSSKHIVQLYVIREKAEGIVLPESCVVSSRTVGLPKFSFGQTSVLGPVTPSFSVDQQSRQ